MTTTRKTVPVTVDVRSWRDINPKVRNAAIAFTGTGLITVGEFLLHTVTLTGLITTLASGLLTIGAAYVTTSTHREVIEGDVKEAVALVATAGPVVAELAPAAAPLVADVEHAAAAVSSFDFNA